MKIYKYLLFAFILTMIDYIWLKMYMISEYKKLFNQLKLDMNVHMISVLLAYFMLITAYPVLIEDNDKNISLKKGTIFGALAYGIYGFTLSAILPKYDLLFALKETIWGATLYFLSISIINRIY